MRLYLWLGSVAAVLAVLAAVYFTGRQDAKGKSELDGLKGTVEKSEKYNEGKSNDAGASWYDRLLQSGSSD